MKIQNRQQVLSVAAIAVVALLLLDRVVITPIMNGWKTRETDIKSYEDKIEKGKRMVERADQTRARWENMKTNTLAEGDAERKLLEAFQRWSDEARISVSSIQPSKRIEEDHISEECRASLSGSIGSLARFLYAMEKDSMGIKVESLEITSRDDNGRNLSIGLTVSGLILTEAQE
jgi:F0F1-type ATP synthase membrane subunit b/b'